MQSPVLAMPAHLDWKQAYLAAIYEKDCTRVEGLIQDAIAKLSTRLHQLHVHGLNPCDEGDAIHDALYMLQALERSLAYRDHSSISA